jgi:hypothetical protein
MRKTTLFVLLFGVCAVAKDKKPVDFPVAIHITQVKTESLVVPVSGGGVYTDSNGNVHGRGISGGGTENYHLMMAEIEGRTYGLTVVQSRRHHWLPVGDYKGQWVKGNRALEVLFTNDKGKEQMEELQVASE